MQLQSMANDEPYFGKDVLNFDVWSRPKPICIGSSSSVPRCRVNMAYAIGITTMYMPRDTGPTWRVQVGVVIDNQLIRGGVEVNPGPESGRQT